MSFDYSDNLAHRLRMVESSEALAVRGRVRSLTGLTVEVADFLVPVGSQCEIVTRTGRSVAGEVIGFRQSVSIVMPLGEMTGIGRGDWVECRRSQARVPVGRELLGRVVNASGEALDGAGPLLCQVCEAVGRAAPLALQRSRISEPIGTGIRAIDALVTCGRGQRMGIFSGPGVGKSVLLGMIARHTSADVTVIALVGERGREVREFLEKDLGPAGLKRSVVVVSTSDEPAPVRVRAGFTATTIAEYFRDQGLDVLLLMDSVTRIALAQRQIGLAAGEPPATKGFTPSVFGLLPQLVERSGKTERGSITGFYTVLVEGDDLTEPVSDTMRGLLDGHLWLSRALANRGHYPAIDVLESISRVMPDVVDGDHRLRARDIGRLVAIYRDVEDLVNIGAYAAGSQPEVDLAVRAQGQINAFLQQEMDEHVSFEEAREQLAVLFEALRGLASGQGGQGSEPKEQREPSAREQRSGLGMERMMAGL